MLASTLIKILNLKALPKNYSLSNNIDFNFESDFDKQKLYKKLVVYNCKGCSLQEIFLQTKFRTSLKESSVEIRKIFLKRNQTLRTTILFQTLFKTKHLLIHKTDLLVIRRTLIRNKLTDNRIDCVLEKLNSNENFKYYLNSLRKKNLNRVIIAQLNINSIRNKLDLLTKGIKWKADVLMISETEIDETFPSREFYIEGFTAPYRLDCHGGSILLVYVKENILSKLIEINSFSRKYFY